MNWLHIAFPSSTSLNQSSIVVLSSCICPCCGLDLVPSLFFLAKSSISLHVVITWHANETHELITGCNSASTLMLALVYVTTLWFFSGKRHFFRYSKIKTLFGGGGLQTDRLQN